MRVVLLVSIIVCTSWTFSDVNFRIETTNKALVDPPNLSDEFVEHLKMLDKKADSGTLSKFIDSRGYSWTDRVDKYTPGYYHNKQQTILLVVDKPYDADVDVLDELVLYHGHPFMAEFGVTYDMDYQAVKAAVQNTAGCHFIKHSGNGSNWINVNWKIKLKGKIYHFDMEKENLGYDENGIRMLAYRSVVSRSSTWN